MTDQDLLDLAARLAQRAAAAILTVRDAGFAVEHKDDLSPVTAADRLAEAIIAEGLREAAPDIPVVAEEEVSGGALLAASPRYWLVDPLDGTREFAAGRAEFTVNIGLIEGGRPKLGAVAIPATGELFTGILGLGAWKEDAGGRRPIQARRVPEEGLVVMASRHYKDDPRLPRFLEGRKVQRIVNMGSAVKFCRLAEGTGDLYPRFGRTMEWDTAAPEAVLLAAGGRCTDFEGRPLAYGKPGWENPPFLCQGAESQGVA
ncbi:MAG TPA: 3'(2'),5'-bisphosphate nucleotidase CysQ [Roseomonas sp.]|nr:3'(2'),5'-bisphosphate nucleotidase CysQ [Roseomonas sp.]